ncbi:MAG: ATP-dependent DNA helicase [Patescibacteria group bacterium]
MAPDLLAEYESEYKKLNKKQREAVEAIEGPVMVVAGPGTGKTQILALRIANVLKKTDIKADGVLALTFTNAAALAMRTRLSLYIGADAEKAGIFTFHSFGLTLIEEYYSVLGLAAAPTLLEEKRTISFFEELLRTRKWQYLLPRFDEGRYFSDLKSIISALKREIIRPEEAINALDTEIKNFDNDPANISSRGKNKGEIKEEAKRRREVLGKTREALEFYALYEEAKREQNVIDYDDVMTILVELAGSADVRSDILEQYLYVLVDEHQDSSGLQNEFLKKIWGDVEEPNIFVVGDDRQLIYGFGGASIAYFYGFRDNFPGAKLIGLVENYRSTPLILEIAEHVLPGKLTEEKLRSQKKDSHPIGVWFSQDQEAEILEAAGAIKEKIAEGIPAEECAILMPKNAHVRRAIAVLRAAGLPVSIRSALALLALPEAQSFIRVLRVMRDSADHPTLALTLFDPISGVAAEEAHQFLSSGGLRNFSLSGPRTGNLLSGVIDKWFEKLSLWAKGGAGSSLAAFVTPIARELLDAETARAFLSLLKQKNETEPELGLDGFINFLDRIQKYGEDLEIEGESESPGARVLTLHGSKGLEFEFVWIAHMDERSFTSERRRAFALPEPILARLEKEDLEVHKRELFVAITRAKRFVNISYSGGELAHAAAAIPENLLVLKKPNVEKRETRTGQNNFAELAKAQFVRRNVSVWLLNNFFECTRKWYFLNILGLPEKKNAVLEYGKAVHSAISQIINQKRPVTEADAKAVAANTVAETGFWQGAEAEEVKKSVAEVLTRFALKRLPELGQDFKSERSLSGRLEKLPRFSLYGKIDLVERLPDAIRVVDFKTGSAKRKSEIEKLDPEGRPSAYLRQLAMYAHLLAPEARGLPIIGRLEFVEADGDFYERKITKEDIGLLEKDIADYARLVESGEWLKRECNFNSYGKNIECAYCKLSLAYK